MGQDAYSRETFMTREEIDGEENGVEHES